MAQRRCVVCDAEFIFTQTTQRYCSRRCKWAAIRERDKELRRDRQRRYEARHPERNKRPARSYAQTCAQCGAGFKAKWHKHRCDQCVAESKPKPQTECVVPWIECGWCGHWIVGRGRRRFCSIECQRIGCDARKRQARPVWYRDCKECLRLFVAHTEHMVFCSQVCGERSVNRRAKQKRRGLPPLGMSPRAIFERDGWRCGLCGGRTLRTKSVPHPKAPTLDHIVPLSKGGEHAPTNLQTAHFECNWRKGDAICESQLRLIGA